MKKATLSELASREKLKNLTLRTGFILLEVLLGLLLVVCLPICLLIGLLVHILYKIDRSFSFSLKIETPKRED